VRAEGLINATSSNGSLYAGGLVGQTNSANTFNQNFTNVRANIGSGNSYLGGVVGQAEYSSFINITTLGRLNGKAHVGGIVGAGSSINLQNIISKANIIATGSYIGGIAGSLSNSNVKDTSFDGNISASNSEYVGGFVGSMSRTNVELSTFSGIVSGFSFVGGIAGNAESSSIIQRVTVSGHVKASDSRSWQVIVGGIAGQILTSTITEAISIGKVETTGNGNEQVRLGGIAGRLWGGSRVTNVYSNVTYLGENYIIGGVAGRTDGDEFISNAFVIISENVNNNPHGLFVAWHWAGKLNISNSFANTSKNYNSVGEPFYGYSYTLIYSNSNLYSTYQTSITTIMLHLRKMWSSDIRSFNEEYPT
jgi:hypothetical protein